MSNLANYSPYNKTYKFLMFQNQAYHEKNKTNAKPCVRTNIRYPKTSYQSYRNPESNELLLPFQKPMTRSTQRCESPVHSQTRSMLLSNENYGLRLDKEKKVIHKHQSFEKFRSKKIKRQNGELNSRLLGTSCEVIKNTSTSNSFGKHLKYKDIRAKFDENGKRKHVLAMGKLDLLCPTLNEFNGSDVGQKFLDLDMSIISKNSSPRNSPLLNKRKNIFSNKQ